MSIQHRKKRFSLSFFEANDTDTPDGARWLCVLLLKRAKDCYGSETIGATPQEAMRQMIELVKRQGLRL